MSEREEECMCNLSKHRGEIIVIRSMINDTAWTWVDPQALKAYLKDVYWIQVVKI